MGVNLCGESPLYVNQVDMLNMLTKVLVEGKYHFEIIYFFTSVPLHYYWRLSS